MTEYGIIIKQGEIHYEDSPDSILGAGETATIYKSKPFGDKSRQYAIKVPNVDRQDELRHEHEVLVNIAQGIKQIKENELGTDIPQADTDAGDSEKKDELSISVPQAQIGTRKIDNRYVMVMPIYQTSLKTVIQNLLLQNDFITAEKLATRSMIEFLYATQALHDTRQETCPDRKISDFFLFGKSSQLVVIDWNVRRGNSAAEQQAEMAIIGRLWHELFLGHQGTRPFHAFVDSKWQPVYGDLSRIPIAGMVSLGMRRLLEKMVDEAHVDPSLMREAFQAWFELLSLQDVMGLVDEIQHSQVTDYKILGSQISLTKNQSLAILADLAWRQHDKSTNSNWYQNRQAAVERVLSEMDKAQEQVYDYLQKGDTAAAQNEINTLLPRLEKTNPILWGNLSRWQLFISLREKRSFNMGRPLQGFEEQLRDKVFRPLGEKPSSDSLANLDSIKQHLQTVQGRLQNRGEQDPTATEVLAILENEIALREKLINYHETKKPTGSFNPNLTAELEKQLHEIQKQSELIEYFNPTSNLPTLLTSVIDLEQELAEISASRTQAGKVNDKLNTLLSLLEERRFEDCIQQYNQFVDESFGAERDAITQQGSKLVNLARFAKWTENNDPHQLSDIVAEAENLLITWKSHRLLSRIKPLIRDYENTALQKTLNTLKRQLAPGTWEAVQQAEPTYHQIEMVQKQYLELFQELANPQDQSIKHYEDLSTFYHTAAKELFGSNGTASFDSDAAARRLTIKQAVEAKYLDVDKVLQLLDRGREVGANVASLEQDLLPEILAQPDSSLSEILRLGLQRKLHEQTQKSIKEYKESIQESWNAEQVDLQKNHNAIVSQYEANSTKLETLIKELDLSGQGIAILTDLQKQHSKLAEALAQVKKDSTDNYASLTGKIDSIQSSIPNLVNKQDFQEHQERVENFLAVGKILQDIQSEFIKKDMNKVASYLKQLQAWIQAHQTNEEVGFVKQQLLEWYTLQRRYRSISIALQNTQKELAQINKEKNPKNKLDFLWYKIQSLLFVVEHSHPIVFRAVYEDWMNAFTSTRDLLQSASKPRLSEQDIAYLSMVEYQATTLYGNTQS